MRSHSEREFSRRRVLAALGAGSSIALAGCPGAPQADSGNETSTPTPTPSGEQEGPSESPTNQVEQLDKYPRVEVGTVNELGQGDVSTFAYPLNGQENFLTRLSEGAWGGVGPSGGIVAYSSMCTHMGCSVGGNVEPGNATAGPCPCHYTTFDLSKGGLTVVGPATTDLPQIELEIEDGTIYATGVDGLMYGHRNNLRDGEPVVTPEGEPADSDDSSGQFDGYLDDANNYDGSTVDATGQDQVTVAVGAGSDGLAFDPTAVTVDANTTIVWEWTGEGGTHNVIAEDGTFDSGDPVQTGTFEHTFEETGTHLYYCSPHKAVGMKGAVVVE